VWQWRYQQWQCGSGGNRQWQVAVAQQPGSMTNNGRKRFAIKREKKEKKEKKEEKKAPLDTFFSNR
jgi:hypothetical protein